MKTIWNKQTGVASSYEGVDAREILANSPDIYTDVDPNGAKDPDGDGFEGGPQRKATAELKAKLDDMTVDELKAHAKANSIDLGDATLKADIRAAIDLASGK